ncbi:hypothetical protein KSP40_PGU004762 [Platanthera guangdongensis]|uniref:Uncharacterized protein n=1 Tax=Platanthera guangdongensis TaxID=2320717 RepID=A0ABR2LPM2_9ASPA
MGEGSVMAEGNTGFPLITSMSLLIKAYYLSLPAVSINRGRSFSGKGSQSHVRTVSKCDINSKKIDVNIIDASAVSDVHSHSGSEVDDVHSGM